MARVVIPANSWVDVKALLGLTDDIQYSTSNEGNSILQVITTQDSGIEPVADPYSIGIKQYSIGNTGSYWSHSSAVGKGIWVYSHDKEGQIEVQI
jgi:hypothetical protein